MRVSYRASVQTREEWDAEDRVWVTYVPSLNHLSTYGETEAEALERTREAIAGYCLEGERSCLGWQDRDFQHMARRTGLRLVDTFPAPGRGAIYPSSRFRTIRRGCPCLASVA
jgi:predicted RNase H-like HicB family nuclease